MLHLVSSVWGVPSVVLVLLSVVWLSALAQEFADAEVPVTCLSLPLTYAPR